MNKKLNGKKYFVRSFIIMIVMVLILPSGFVMANTFDEKQDVIIVNAGPAEGIINRRDIQSNPLIGEEMIGYYDHGSIDFDAIGVSGGEPPYTWEAAIRLTPEELEPYDGWELRAAHFYYHEDMGHSGSLKIYAGGSSNTPGELLTSRSFTTSYSGWQRIDLLDFVTIDATSDLWISIEIISSDGEYPFSVDAGPSVEGKGGWVYLFGSWSEMPDLNPLLDYNWCIEGVVAQGSSYGTELEISDVRGIFGLKSIIRNKGSFDATDVQWDMSVIGGVFNRINKTVSGLIPKLSAGSEETVRSGFFFGFGKINITITVEAENANVIFKKVTGFVFGPFVFGVKS